MDSLEVPLPQPRQRRSERTLQRILDAFERALDERTFEEITVAEICEGASCSVGSFYGRVGTKEGLLEHLRHRAYAEGERALAAVFDPERFAELPFDLELAIQARTLVELHVRRRGVIRALIVQARRRAEFARHTMAFNESMVALARRTWMARRASIQHPEALIAVEQALLITSGYLRESLVFGGLWPGRHAVDPETHVRELTRVLVAYLTGKAPTPRRLDELVAAAPIPDPLGTNEDD